MNYSLITPIISNNIKYKSFIQSRQKKDLELLKLMDDYNIIHSEDEKENIYWARDHLLNYLLENEQTLELPVDKNDQVENDVCIDQSENNKRICIDIDKNEVSTTTKKFSFDFIEKKSLAVSEEEIQEEYEKFKQQNRYKDTYIFLHEQLMGESPRIKNFFDNFDHYKQITDHISDYYIEYVKSIKKNLKNIQEQLALDSETKSVVEMISEIEKPRAKKNKNHNNKLETPEEKILYNRYCQKQLRMNRKPNFDSFFYSDLLDFRNKKLKQKIEKDRSEANKKRKIAKKAREQLEFQTYQRTHPDATYEDFVDSNRPVFIPRSFVSGSPIQEEFLPSEEIEEDFEITIEEDTADPEQIEQDVEIELEDTKDIEQIEQELDTLQENIDKLILPEKNLNILLPKYDVEPLQDTTTIAEEPFIQITRHKKVKSPYRFCVSFFKRVECNNLDKCDYAHSTTEIKPKMCDKKNCNQVVKISDTQYINNECSSSTKRCWKIHNRETIDSYVNRMS
jgi:hypothetical protein